MIIFKKINIFLSFFMLFILTSCNNNKSKEITNGRDGYRPTSDLVFCANAMYDSKEDIPKIVLSYCCFEEKYNGDVKLYFHLGQTSSIMVSGKVEKIYDELIIPHNDSNYIYSLCEVDEKGNKIGFQQKLYTYGIDDSGNGSIFIKPFGKYILYCWFANMPNEIVLPRNIFSSENGEIYLTAYKTNKNNGEEVILSTITIEYINDGNNISLIPPKNSFSGKDGLTDEERFS